MVSSMARSNIRIIVGTIVGGCLGFYVMHRLEISYREKWEERLRNYEEELKMRKRKSQAPEESV